MKEEAADQTADDLERCRVQVEILKTYLDRTDPFWRNRVEGLLEA